MLRAALKLGYGNRGELTFRGDGIQFDAASCRIFGKRYIEKHMELAKSIR